VTEIERCKCSRNCSITGNFCGCPIFADKKHPLKIHLQKEKKNMHAHNSYNATAEIGNANIICYYLRIKSQKGLSKCSMSHYMPLSCPNVHELGKLCYS
jgi:hypothetical protein